MGQKTYRIGEAAAKLNLKTYVLRFWEMEFPQIAPIRTEKGQRLYTESDLAVLGRIRYLLHERGLTIEGARRLLQEEAARGAVYTDVDMPPSDESLADATEDILPGGEKPAAQEAESRAVQVSLFPVPERETAFHISENDMRGIVAELSAIRELLVSTDPSTGDMP